MLYIKTIIHPFSCLINVDCLSRRGSWISNNVVFPVFNKYCNVPTNVPKFPRDSIPFGKKAISAVKYIMYRSLCVGKIIILIAAVIVATMIITLLFAILFVFVLSSHLSLVSLSRAKQLNRPRFPCRSIFLFILGDYYYYYYYLPPKGGLLIIITSRSLCYFKAEYNFNKKAIVSTWTLYVHTANKNFITARPANKYIF